MSKDYYPVVSIIIPVYNSETYLENCLLSVLNQTFKNYEIIIINDCSTDDCSNIIDRYKRSYEKIIVISNEKNLGVSKSRNLGIKYAKGIYILFIDSDDCMKPDMLETMVHVMEVNKLDVCICNFLNKEGLNISYTCQEDDFIMGIEKDDDLKEYIFNYFFLNKHKYCVWNRLYRLSIIKKHNLSFKDNEFIYPEDLLFNLEVCIYVSKISWINKPLYIHNIHKNSLSKSKRPNAVKRAFNMCDNYYSTIKKNCLDNKLNDLIYYLFLYSFFNNIKKILLLNDESFFDLYKNIRACLQNKTFLLAIKSNYFDENKTRKKIKQILNLKLKFIASVYIYWLLIYKKNKF